MGWLHRKRISAIVASATMKLQMLLDRSIIAHLPVGETSASALSSILAIWMPKERYGLFIRYSRLLADHAGSTIGHECVFSATSS